MRTGKAPLFVALVAAIASSGLSLEGLRTNGSNAFRSVDRKAERQALVTIFEETSGRQWLRQGGWLNVSFDHCLWEGVSCDNSTGLVNGLELAENQMEGPLASLAPLESLNFVNMSQNKLRGSIDDIGIENLKEIQYLNLAENEFNGTLGEIQESLTFLDLSGNELDGTIKHPGRSSNLAYLNLADNNFAAINISRLTSLRRLDLSRNPNLSQTISESGISNLAQLKSLNLADANFSGPLNISQLVSLELLDLSNNEHLHGAIEDTGILNMTELQHCDLSGGSRFSGIFNFSQLISLRYLSLEGNDMSGNFTGIGALTSLRHCNLGDNNFNGTLSEIEALTSLDYLDLRRNNLSGGLGGIEFLSQLRQLHLGENRFNGTIPELPTALNYLNLSHNELNGTIPDLSQLQFLQRIDLSNQSVSYYDSASRSRVRQGISGPIPRSVAQLYFLQDLILSDNLLTSTIPDLLGRLAYLRVINLENNQISGTIPSTFNILEQLDIVALARNRLYGPIPNLGASIQKIRRVTLQGNPGLESPAPFELCDLDDLDLRQDETYCPSERSALAAFYVATKGPEWNNNTNWINAEKHHCSWFGVGCNDDDTKVVSIKLISNGVSGRIPAEFFNLLSLESMDLNDNDLRGHIPSEIGRLTHLKKLRLSYNLLTGIPKEFENLKNLSMLHLHGNRLTGDDDHITLVNGGTPHNIHKFISDCGDPTDAVAPFECDGCDMCCNSLEECQEPLSSRYGGYESAGIVMASVFAFCCVAYVLVQVFVRVNVLSLSTTSAHEACGEESVYSFFLTKSYVGWLIALLTLAVQVAIFGLFLQASSFDTEISDFVYSWRCPRNTEECNDERTVTAYGWTMWVLLVFASLTDDLANGIKLIYLSASRSSMPCFVSGVMIFSITVLAVWTSAVYNRAIAMSNTELIVNAVILLFVNDLDDMIFNAIRVMFLKWTRGISSQAESFSTELLEKRSSDNAVTRDEKNTTERNAVHDSSRGMEKPPTTLSKSYETEPLEEKDCEFDISRASFFTAIESSASQRNITNDQHDALLLKIVNLENKFSELHQTVELQRRMLQEGRFVDERLSKQPHDNSPQQLYD